MKFQEWLRRRVVYMQQTKRNGIEENLVDLVGEDPKDEREIEALLTIGGLDPESALCSPFFDGATRAWREWRNGRIPESTPDEENAEA